MGPALAAKAEDGPGVHNTGEYRRTQNASSYRATTSTVIATTTKTVRSGQARASHGGQYSYTMLHSMAMKVKLGRIKTARTAGCAC
jgi:hypothetical protein